MRTFLLALLAGCGTSQGPGAPRDFGDIPDSHVGGDEDLGTRDQSLSDQQGVTDLPAGSVDLTAPPSSDLASTLDPNLSLPNANGQPCTSPGAFSGCPSIQ